MSDFKLIFGTESRNIKKTCVLLPFMSKTISRALGAGDFEHGKLYKTADAKAFSVVYTGTGPAMVGDAILHLKGTACENAILLGSCGTLPDTRSLDVSSIVCLQKAYSIESFSSMLLLSHDWPSFDADKTLYEDFLEFGKGQVSAAVSATTGSLKLEDVFAQRFRSLRIDVVDMESSAFYSSAAFSGIKALAVLYISDIIGKKPFYRNLAAEEKDKLNEASHKTAEIICRFASQLTAS